MPGQEIPDFFRLTILPENLRLQRFAPSQRIYCYRPLGSGWLAGPHPV